LTVTVDPLLTFRRALVVGTVRNASKFVASDISRIIQALDPIIPTVAFIVESDSSDKTIEKLTALSAKDSRVQFVSLGNLEPLFPERLERLKHCRNVYLEQIRNNPIYRECDLVIVADLDGINTAITQDKIRLALATKVKWDVLAANQSGPYYDILALRHPFWSPNSFIQEMEWLDPFLGKKAAWRHSLGDRMIKISPSHPLIEVDSAFGGLCIYRRWVLEKFDYSNDSPSAAAETDHVILNRKAKAYGAKIYIHPGLINSKWTTHSLDAIPIIRFSKSVVHLFPLRVFLPILRRLTIWVGTRH
jgi:hypothetical protein